MFRAVRARRFTTAVELRKPAPETEAVFSLSSDEGGGEGRGEELGFIGFPLSPTLSPLVPREARESQRKVHRALIQQQCTPASRPEERVNRSPACGRDERVRWSCSFTNKPQGGADCN